MGVAAIINLYFIHRYIGYRMEIPQLLKTIGASLVMAGAVKLFYDFTISNLQSEVFSTFGAVFVGCFVYIVTMVLIGGILEQDMKRIPMIGKYAIKVFRRLGVFKTTDEQEVGK